MKRNKNGSINEIKKKANLKQFNTKEKNGIILGNFEDIPKYFQHNEYIKKGYRIKCNSISSALKSLFFLHNESVNIYSHLLGAFFFIFLIWFTSYFITNYKTQLKNVKICLNEIEKENFNISTKIEDDTFNILKNKFNIFKYDLENLKFNISIIYKSSFIALNETYYNIYKNISQHLKKYFYSLNLKFNELSEKLLDLLELENIFLGNNKINNLRFPKKLGIWPLFVFLISAIICLAFSSIFHLIGNISTNYHRILSRFDYGGVCLLITGSCYPPYYYFFYCEPKYRLFYLTFMTTFGLTTFGLCLTNGFNLPDKRILRGSSFLIFGISAGIPILHSIIAKEGLKGYSNETRFMFWHLGSITYVSGALLYLIRFPEKYYPGKFDFFGSSHQLLHIAVLIAVFFHYIGSLDAYYSRFNNLCQLND